MRRSPDAGWEVTKALPNDEMVIDIDRAGARWLVLAARIKPAPFPGLVDVDGLKVYSGVRDDASDLALLKTVDLQHRTLPQGLGTRGQVWAGAYYLNAVTALERLDPATLQWQPLQPGHPVSHFRVAEPSGLLTAFLAQGMFSKLSVSADAGKTWRRMETPPYTVDDVQVLDPQTAQATRWSAGAFTANIEFLRYDLAGQTWPRILEAAPEACRRTFKTQDGAAVFCLSRGGSILRFDGKGLVVEFAAD
ncbi:hypothetical protein [Chitinimonas koreensis]|nr:hypothetical protein [Chitinimonas koreensis]QNM94850.1 hypothetical protein H9L41_13010 [Chitinimonas koreensis]